MAQVYLINPTVMNEYEDLSQNIKTQRILNMVKKMQDLDLKLFLGHPLYYDLITHITTAVPGVIVFDGTTPAEYENLVNGCTYVDRRGHTIIYEGLIPMMVYFTLSRFTEADAIRFTATGPATKPHDGLDPLRVSDVTKVVQMQRSIANAHANEAEKFLYDKKADFPLWRFNHKLKTARQAGPRIRGIDRNEFNNPNGGAWGSNSDFFDVNGLL